MATASKKHTGTTLLAYWQVTQYTKVVHLCLSTHTLVSFAPHRPAAVLPEHSSSHTNTHAFCGISHTEVFTGAEVHTGESGVNHPLFILPCHYRLPQYLSFSATKMTRLSSRREANTCRRFPTLRHSSRLSKSTCSSLESTGRHKVRTWKNNEST